MTRCALVKEKRNLVSIVPPAKCSIIYLCKHDVNERVRGKHKQISLRFVMIFWVLSDFSLSLVSFFFALSFSHFLFRSASSKTNSRADQHAMTTKARSVSEREGKGEREKRTELALDERWSRGRQPTLIFIWDVVVYVVIFLPHTV